MIERIGKWAASGSKLRLRVMLVIWGIPVIFSYLFAVLWFCLSEAAKVFCWELKDEWPSIKEIPSIWIKSWRGKQ